MDGAIYMPFPGVSVINVCHNISMIQLFIPTHAKHQCLLGSVINKQKFLDINYKFMSVMNTKTLYKSGNKNKFVTFLPMGHR